MASSIETTSTTTTLKNNGNTYLSVDTNDDVTITNDLAVTGNTGIGTTTPTNGKLEVTHSSATVPAGHFRNTSGSGDSPSLIVQGGANNTGGNLQVKDYAGNVDFQVTGAGTAICSKGATIFNHLNGTVHHNGGSRALNTNYTNSEAYDKIIYVSVSNASASAIMITALDGDTIYGSVDPTAGAYYSATYIWPAGKVININMNGTPTLQRWVEYA